MVPPFCILLLLLGVFANGVAAASDVSEGVAVAVLSVFIAFFVVVSVILVLIIIVLKRDLKQRNGTEDDARSKKHRGITRVPTDVGIKGVKSTRSNGGLNTIREVAGEDQFAGNMYDSVGSKMSTFYEKVQGPNPAYSQYETPDVINNAIFGPEETVENSLYSVPNELVEEKPTVTTFESGIPASNAPLPVYAVVQKKSSRTSAQLDQLNPPYQELDPTTSDQVPVYAVPEKKISRISKDDPAPPSPFKTRKVTPNSVPIDPNQKVAAPDLSIFQGTKPQQSDNEPPAVEDDDVFDENAVNPAPPAHVYQRSDTISSTVSTTSDDRPLFDTSKKLTHGSNLTPKQAAKFAKQNPKGRTKKNISPKQSDQGMASKPPLAQKPIVDPILLQLSHSSEVVQKAPPKAKSKLTDGKERSNLLPDLRGNPLELLRAKASPIAGRRALSPPGSARPISGGTVSPSQSSTSKPGDQTKMGPRGGSKTPPKPEPATDKSALFLSTGSQMKPGHKADEKAGTQSSQITRDRPSSVAVSPSYYADKERKEDTQSMTRTSHLSFKEKRKRDSDALEDTIKALESDVMFEDFFQ